MGCTKEGNAIRILKTASVADIDFLTLAATAFWSRGYIPVVLKPALIFRDVMTLVQAS